MADFERDFQVQNVIRLEQNYRSHGNILDAANALIANNRNRLGKNLWTAAGAGRAAARVRGRVRRRRGALARRGSAGAGARRHARWRDIACCTARTRSRGCSSTRCSRRAFPTASTAGLRFFERAEIKHALAYLRLVADPDDDNAFLRVVNFPPRGIGARTIEQLQDAAKQTWHLSLYAAVAGCGQGRRALQARLIEDLKAETAGLPLPEMVEHVLERSGLIAHYKAEREGADRIENLNELVNAAAAFVRGRAAQDRGRARPTPTRSTAFLTHAALEAGEHQAGEGQDALQMMTVHSAKGLEFHAVFITGLEEGLFPHEQSVDGARRPGGGAPPHLRGDHARAHAPVPVASRRRACCTARRATTSPRASSTRFPRR